MKRLIFAIRSSLALFMGTWLMIKGVEWIGHGIGVKARFFIGVLGGLTVGVISPYPKSFFILVSFVLFLIDFGRPENSNEFGAVIDIAFGVLVSWAAVTCRVSAD